MGINQYKRVAASYVEDEIFQRLAATDCHGVDGAAFVGTLPPRSDMPVRIVVDDCNTASSTRKSIGNADCEISGVVDVKLKRSRRDKARVVIPSREELRAILNAAEGRWRPLIITAAFTGLRASELRGLRWSDIDLSRKVVLTVSQRADAWKALGPPKSEAGTRDVPLSPIVVNTLREWRLACPRGQLDLVFPAGSGEVEHHPNIVSRGWNPTQIEAGVVEMVDVKDEAGNSVKVARARYNFHALRHAAASMFIESRMTPKRVQAIMGHSSIMVTFDTYGHLFADDEVDQTAMRSIEARVFG